VIERRKSPRQRVGGSYETAHVTPNQISGDIRHRRDQQEWIVYRHLYRIGDRRVGGPAVHIVDAENVGQEQRVEFAALEDSYQLDSVVERVVVVGAIMPMRR
jgi:hypothetical protein